MDSVDLISECEITVRFSDTDAMGVVWHGEYLKYFEDGRESFGEKYGLSYWYIYDNEVLTPVVKVLCEYKRSISFGEKIVIRTKFINSQAAKIIFEYEVFEKTKMTLVATGRTEQVFTDISRNLLYYFPDFFLDWKKKWNLI